MTQFYVTAVTLAHAFWLKCHNPSATCCYPLVTVSAMSETIWITNGAAVTDRQRSSWLQSKSLTLASDERTKQKSPSWGPSANCTLQTPSPPTSNITLSCARTHISQIHKETASISVVKSNNHCGNETGVGAILPQWQAQIHAHFVIVTHGLNTPSWLNMLRITG